MVKLFERAYELDNKNLALNRALLEIYLRVPRFFGGGDKKALSIIKIFILSLLMKVKRQNNFIIITN